MFVLRSLFWLLAAYVVMQPQANLRMAAESLSGQAVSAGQQLIVDQIRISSCDSLHCNGSDALLTTVLSASRSGDSTMQDSTSTVPIPRPRPPRID